MEKPLKPKKPSRNESVPSDVETVEKIVMTKNYKDIILLSTKEYEKYNKEEDEPQWMVDGLDNFGEGLKYSDVIKFKKLLPPEIEDFTIEESSNCDGYYEYTYLTYKQKKNPAQYQEELNNYNNRFIKYEKALTKYEEEIVNYENWRKEQKIQKLQEELTKAQKI